MALNTTNFSRLTNYAAPGVCFFVPTVWTYTTTDNLSDIGEHYFDALGISIREGDWIRIIAADGNTILVVSVVNANPTGPMVGFTHFSRDVIGLSQKENTMSLPTLIVDMTGNTEVADAQVLTFDSQTGTELAKVNQPYLTVSSVSPPTFSAPKGSVCLSTAGSSTSTRLYVNTTGSTVWTAVTTAA